MVASGRLWRLWSDLFFTNPLDSSWLAMIVAMALIIPTAGGGRWGAVTGTSCDRHAYPDDANHLRR